VTEQIAPLPRATLANGMTIAFEAIDPTTGAAVTGVKVTNVAIYADGVDSTDAAVSPVEVSLPDTAPLWAPLPVEST
jgi:hypothetical protein